MNSRAYAPHLAALVASLMTFASASVATAHTGQQAFDTLESITGEQSDLSIPIPQYVSLQLDLTEPKNAVHYTAPFLTVTK